MAKLLFKVIRTASEADLESTVQKLLTSVKKEGSCKVRIRCTHMAVSPTANDYTAFITYKIPKK